DQPRALRQKKNIGKKDGPRCVIVNPVESEDTSSMIQEISKLTPHENEDVQEINAEEFEPPAKKANLSESTEFSDLNEDSPGRWEASEELSSLLNVLFIDKTLSTYERKQITKEFPRPNIEAVYTPVLDNYLSSLIAGAKGVDKEPKRLQDQILDVVGPLSMVFEHVSGWQSSQDSAETITVPSNNINGLYACLTKALCLLGSINNQLTVQRRKQILDKLNPKLNSLATEPFPDAGKMLFGESFEEKTKQRNETARIISAATAKKPANQFFRRGAPSSYRPWRGGQERGRWNYQARGSGQITGRLKYFKTFPAMMVTGFLSTLFVVPKKGGGHRPIFNLKQLNHFVQYEHFKMEGIHMLRDLLQPNDYMAKIDLKDVYFTIPIWKDHQKFLRFLWKDTHWEFMCLPFGLASAPRVFTKILKPIVGLLRKQGIRLIIYLDDILLIASTAETLSHYVTLTVALLELLGFVVNYQKSQLNPVQSLEFLGFQINSGSYEAPVIWGLWSQTERLLHINCLELLAGGFALKSFLKSKCNIHVLLLMDNTSAISYINKMGGSTSLVLSSLAFDLWQWCLERSITVEAHHLPGRLNTVADYESRAGPDSSDWQLDPVVFQKINSKWGPFAVDLFATRLTAQLPRFVSWKPDPVAEAVDAFTLDWSQLAGYVFPPFALIGRCLRQIQQQVIETRRQTTSSCSPAAAQGLLLAAWRARTKKTYSSVWR
ncbi:Hypothetical predicted protein, partial [Paramuricea clavata]